MAVVAIEHVAVQLRPTDNVAIAARNLPAGSEIQIAGRVVTLSQRIGLGHKIAIFPIKKGEAIYKYGQVIGFASAEIPLGGHVHVHNVSADAFERDDAFCRDCPLPPAAPLEKRTFSGV